MSGNAAIRGNKGSTLLEQLKGWLLKKEIKAPPWRSSSKRLGARSYGEGAKGIFAAWDQGPAKESQNIRLASWRCASWSAWVLNKQSRMESGKSWVKNS